SHGGGRQRATLFPYTTLFRSIGLGQGKRGDGAPGQPGEVALLLLRRAEKLERLRQADRLMRGEERRQVAVHARDQADGVGIARQDRKSTRLNSSHVKISYAVF